MLKRVCLFLTLIIATISLIGCETKEPIMEESTELQNKIYESFDTYEKLDMWFAKDENEIAPVMEEMSLHGERYKEFVSNILAGEYGIVKPYWGDEKMQLQNKEGFTNIAVRCVDGRRPWIWYHCRLEGVQCTIGITYLTKDEMEQLKEKPFEKIVITDPSFVEENVGDMMLRDKTVSIIYGKSRNDEQIHTKFVYDNVFVLISVDENVFHNANWQEFSLRTE